MNTGKKNLSLSHLVEKLRKPGMFSTLVRGTGIVFISQGIGAGLGFVLQVCLARWMGASEYGFYVYVIAWATLGAMFSALGFGPSLLRFVPEYKTNQDESRLKGVLQGSLGIAIITSVAFAVLASGVVILLNMQRGVDHAASIIIGFWVIPFLAINTLSMNMLRGVRKMTAAYVPSQILRPVIIIIGSYIIFSSGGYASLGSDAVLIITIIALVVVELFAGWQIHKFLPLGEKKVRATYEIRNWLRISLPLLLIGGFVKIIKQTDILMIGMFLTSAHVGYYNAAVKTANLASFALSSVNGIAAPMIASTYAEGNPGKLQKLMIRVTQLILVPSLLMTIGVILLSTLILGAFGSEFREAQWSLIILAIAQFIRATTGPVGYLLELTGHQDESAKVRAASAGLNIVLNVVGISFFGITGAALATAISIIVERIWIDRLVAKHIQINGSLFSQIHSNLSLKKEPKEED